MYSSARRSLPCWTPKVIPRLSQRIILFLAMIIPLSFGGMYLDLSMIYGAYRRILLYRLVFGTPSLRVDLVDANLKFAPTIKSRGLGQLWPFFSFPHPFKGGSFAQVKIIGPILAFDYITRNSEARSTSSSFTFVINVDRIHNAGPTSWKWV